MEVSKLINQNTKVIDIYDIIKNGDDINIMVDLDTNFHLDAVMNIETKEIVHAEFIAQSDMEKIQNATNVVTHVYRIDNDKNALSLITEIIKNNIDEEYLSDFVNKC